jgi:phosphoribosylformimino-5-aminoimidazole carboxamide ribotide isomerase
MTKFRPCIDIHQGKVKQIVGGSLRDSGAVPIENFVSDRSAGWFAELFRNDNLIGGHVIQLGAGNEIAAREALATYPGGLQIGGGIHSGNASEWLDAGASHVIITSALFDDKGKFSEDALHSITKKIGKENLVIDLSCRSYENRWVVAMNRWQTLTDLTVDHATLDRLTPYCDEFLIHAADVEGLCRGIDTELVAELGRWGKCVVTYAGGAATMNDVLQLEQIGCGAVDITVGSALDLFGGKGLKYKDLVAWNSREL